MPTPEFERYASATDRERTPYDTFLETEATARKDTPKGESSEPKEDPLAMAIESLAGAIEKLTTVLDTPYLRKDTTNAPE